MTSFSEVLDLAKSASEALNALEATSHARVLSFFTKFENRTLTMTALRSEMSSQTRAGFVTAGSLAVEHVKALAAEAGLHRLDTDILMTNDLLEQVIEDIERNFQSYEDSEQNDTDFRRLRFRVCLSVKTALRRGFTDNQLAAAGVLREQGATLKKIWLANFVNNSPCATCKALHGTEISLSAEFPHGDEKSPKTFHGLQGPPRHPNCHCYMLCYVVTLDTIASIPQPPALDDQKFMTSRDVRRLPRAVYTAAITTLRLIAGKLKGALRGKR